MLKSFFSKDKIEAGVDEAGRGALAGPVVAAAVILPKDFYYEHINDSKLLSKRKRFLCEYYIKKEAVKYTIGVATNKEIDQMNILNASFLAMHKAIKKLKKEAELLLIDGNRFNPIPEILHKCIVKGDQKYLSIAAASILAKNHRDRIMSTLDKENLYNWKKNKGYPTKEHKELIRKNGISNYHRKSFQLL